MAPSSAATSSAPATPSAITLSNPRGLAIGKDGVIYVGDINDGKVYRLTPDGKISLLAGGSTQSAADGLGKDAGFATPTGLAVDKDGNVYVADGDNNLIRKITPAGKVTTLAGSANSSDAADGKGAAAHFNGATAVAVDKDGNVFVADTHNGVVRKITPDGTVTTVTKPATSPASEIHLSSPRAIALDDKGTLYVADEEQGIVCKVAADGKLTLVAGNPAATTASSDGSGAKAVLLTPRGLAVDAKGNLYVADTDEGLIRKITPDGTVTTIAGKPGATGFVDGKGAVAEFGGPRGLAVDKDGNIYVADSDNSVIRKITPDGTVTTVELKSGTASAAKP